MRKKQEIFDCMLRTISAYFLGLKTKQEAMNDRKESLELMTQVRRFSDDPKQKNNELKRLKKMIKILNRDLVAVSKETGASITFEFLNSQKEQSQTHRSLGNGSRRVNLNQTFDFSSYPTRHDSDDSFAMNQSTNTSMILPRSATSNKKKKRGSKIFQMINGLFSKKKAEG